MWDWETQPELDLVRLNKKRTTMLYIVKYSGPFGFIKPWTAVRDEKTFSQQFLTPSIIEGLRQKLEVDSIIRHKLTYALISIQQQETHPRAWEKKTQ